MGDSFKIKKSHIYKECELVQLLCTDGVKRGYSKKGWFTGGKDKNNFLTKLKMYCEFEFNSEDRSYKIIKVFEQPKTKDFITLNKGMYQYTTPLLLNNIIQNRDSNNKIEIPMTPYEWAKTIRMVNSNYGLVKYNLDSTAEYLDIQENIIVDFIEKTSDSINYYIKETLEKLKKIHLIDLFSTRIICKYITNETAKVDGNIIQVDIKEEKREATDEEIELINDLMEQAMIFAKINLSDSDKYRQCYYGYKAILYQGRLKELLRKHKIKYFYDVYKVFLKSEKRAKSFIDNFEIKNYSELLKEFNQYFIDKLKINLDNRFEKTINKLIVDIADGIIASNKIEDVQNKKILFSNGYNELSEVTIKNETESIYSNMKNKNLLKENINDDEFDYHVIIKKQKNIG